MDKEKKNNGKKKLIITMAVALILLVGITVSYGYIAILGNSKNQEISVGTGDIHLVFDDADTESVNAKLELGQSITKTFKIENKGTKPGKVQINWKNLVNTYNSRSLSYTLETSSSKDTGYTSIEALRENVPVSTEAKEVPLSKEITVPVQSAPVYYRVTITFNNLSDVDQSGDLSATLSTQFSLSEPENLSKKVIAILDGNVKRDALDFRIPSPNNEYEIKKTQYRNGRIASTNVDQYIFYSDSYKFNTVTGKFTLIDPQIEKYSEIYSSLNNKYITGSFFSLEDYDVTRVEDILPSDIEYETSNKSSIRHIKETTLSNYKYTLFSKSGKYIEAKEFNDINSYTTDMSSYTNNVIYYSDEYTFDGVNFELVNPKSCIYSSCYSSLIGKYAIEEIQEGKTIGEVIMKIIEASSSSMTYRFISYDEKGEAYDYSTAGVYAAEDDYGESYYYRGNPTNNYVKFGGFTWRIIRVNGDGSVRLIYANNSSNEGNNIGTVYQSKYYYDVKNFKYMGYMYGGETEDDATTGLSEVNENKFSSPVKKIVDEWYVNNLSSYNNYISDTLFCNDREIYHQNENILYMAGYGRLHYDNTTGYIANPTLKCKNKNDRFTVDDKAIGNGALTYPVGLHTADEDSFAGLAYTEENSMQDFLKQNNYMGQYYLSGNMTPDTAGNRVYIFTTIQLLDINHNYEVAGAAPSISPVVNIKPEYALKMVGSGTESDPFVIPNVG